MRDWPELQRALARIAELEQRLELAQPKPQYQSALTLAEREVILAAGCGWVLERLDSAQERLFDWHALAIGHSAHIKRLEAIIERLRAFVTATAEDEGHLAPEARALLQEVF